MSIAVQLEAGRTDADINQAVETTCAPLQAPYEGTRHAEPASFRNTISLTRYGFDSFVKGTDGRPGPTWNVQWRFHRVL